MGLRADAFDAGDIVQNKERLRARLKRARRLVPREERERVDAAIATQVVALPEFEEAPLLLAYLSFGSEVDTYGILQRAWDKGMDVALPRCVRGTHDMTWHAVTTLEGLERSPIGVLEPRATAPALPAHGLPAKALALVPGLTFDARGYRLGYGGGYYDAFLAGFAGHAVGLCRTAHFTRDLAAQRVIEDHDLPVQMVATEGGVLRA